MTAAACDPPDRSGSTVEYQTGRWARRLGVVWLRISIGRRQGHVLGLPTRTRSGTDAAAL